jgi:glyoxylase-like metal-dependent hydrolase (beta-lactamase superfamily II)
VLEIPGLQIGACANLCNARIRLIGPVELLVITHQHIDHLCLAEMVVQRSGAEVAALGIATERVANFDEGAEAEDRFAVELMLPNGIAEEITAALRSVSGSFCGWGSHVTVTHPLEDGPLFPLRDPHSAGDPPSRP